MPPRANQSNRDLTVDWWDVHNIQQGPLIVVIAKKDTGKSYAVLNILHKLRHRFNSGIVITKTPGTDKNGYGPHVPPLYIYSDFDDEHFCTMMQTEQQTLDYLRHLKKKHPERVPYPDLEKEWFVIIDDCLDDPKVKNSKFMASIGLRGRHANMFTFVVSNSPKQISTSVRAAADYVMIFQLANNEVRKTLFSEYACGDVSFAEWDRLCTALTQNRGVLVINRKKNAIECWRADDEHTKEEWVLGNVNYQSMSLQYAKKPQNMVGDCLGLMKLPRSGDEKKQAAAMAASASAAKDDRIDVGHRITIVRPKPSSTLATMTGSSAESSDERQSSRSSRRSGGRTCREDVDGDDVGVEDAELQHILHANGDAEQGEDIAGEKDTNAASAAAVAAGRTSTLPDRNGNPSSKRARMVEFADTTAVDDDASVTTSVARPASSNPLAAGRRPAGMAKLWKPTDMADIPEDEQPNYETTRIVMDQAQIPASGNNAAAATTIAAAAAARRNKTPYLVF